MPDDVFDGMSNNIVERAVKRFLIKFVGETINAVSIDIANKGGQIICYQTQTRFAVFQGHLRLLALCDVSGKTAYEMVITEAEVRARYFDLNLIAALDEKNAFKCMTFAAREPGPDLRPFSLSDVGI